jgi:pimeloyl-ACP methyl ester carboxylesterase
MYNKHAESLHAAELAAVGRVLGEIARRFGIGFASGNNPRVQCSNFTLQPAAKHVVHRPLAVYVGIAVAKVLSHTLLFQAGFVPYRCGCLSYWYRPCIRTRNKPHEAGGSSSGAGPSSRTALAEPLPLVFFHGISPGLFTYTPLLKNLVQGRAALLVEMPHVGYGLDLAPPSRDATVASLRRALKRHGIPKACVCGHSYGTFCAAWVVQAAPDLVAQLVLLDPMCLLLALPDVTHNFLYKPLRAGPKPWVDRLVHLMAGSEMGVNNALRRHFWWFNAALFAHEIASVPTVVHLASHDSIAPSRHVRDYLEATFARRLKVTEFGLNEDPSPQRASAAAAAADAAGAGGVAGEVGSAAEAAAGGQPTPPPSPRSGGSASSPRSSNASWSSSKGHSSTLELIWSEGYWHGQIIASPARQRDIAKTMWIQECRIFAEMTHATASKKQLGSSSSGVSSSASRAADSDGDGGSLPPRARMSTSDEFDEAVVRCC